MYYVKNLTEKQLKILKTDDDLYQDYLDIKLTTDEFRIEDENSRILDDQIRDFIQKKELEEKKKPAKPATKKPTKKPASSPQTPKPSPAPPPKKPDKTKDVSRLIGELMETLQENQDANISEEQVKAIIENVINARKICFEDLCEEVSKAINDVKKVKVVYPNGVEGGEFDESIPNIQRIIDDYNLGNNIMLIGGAGTGKTYLAEKVADATVGQTEVINCNQFTSPIEINGGQTIEGYQEGKLINAFKDGKILILDELPKLDPNTAGLLNEALAKTNLETDDPRAFIVNSRGDRYRKKQGFGVIATGNVYPNTESNAYGANNKQDLSLLDRFVGSVYEIEKNPEFEKNRILPGHLFLWAVANQIRNVIEQNKFEAQISIRFMETSLLAYQAEMKLVEDGGEMNRRKTYKDIIDSFLYTLTNVQQKEIVKAIEYDKYFKNYQYRDMDINKNPFK